MCSARTSRWWGRGLIIWEFYEERRVNNAYVRTLELGEMPRSGFSLVDSASMRPIMLLIASITFFYNNINVICVCFFSIY